MDTEIKSPGEEYAKWKFGDKEKTGKVENDNSSENTELQNKLELTRNAIKEFSKLVDGYMGQADGNFQVGASVDQIKTLLDDLENTSRLINNESQVQKANQLLIDLKKSYYDSVKLGADGNHKGRLLNRRFANDVNNSLKANSYEYSQFLYDAKLKPNTINDVLQTYDKFIKKSGPTTAGRFRIQPEYLFGKPTK